MFTFLAIVSVPALLFVLIVIVFILGMCKSASDMDDAMDKALYFERLRIDMQEEAEQLASLPQGHPTDEEEDAMARAIEDGKKDFDGDIVDLDSSVCVNPDMPDCANCPYMHDDECEYEVKVWHDTHQPAPCDTCPYGPLESAACMEHECCPDIMMYHNQEQ